MNGRNAYHLLPATSLFLAHKPHKPTLNITGSTDKELNRGSLNDSVFTSLTEEIGEDHTTYTQVTDPALIPGFTSQNFSGYFKTTLERSKMEKQFSDMKDHVGYETKAHSQVLK